MKKFYLFIILLCIITMQTDSQPPRGRVVWPRSGPGETQQTNSASPGKQYFCLVAIDHYRQWPTLPGPVAEAAALKKILTSRYHCDDITELYNEKAHKEAIRNYLLGLQEGQPGALAENDSLFIYFSGHGQAFGEEPNNGYWIPYNGSSDTEARAYWFSNAELTGLIKKIKSRHICIVSDSCFAATLIDCDRGTIDWHKEKKYVYKRFNRCSRKVLTSGGIERVPGESEFAGLFRRELANNEKSWLPMGVIYQRIGRTVYERTGSFPEYGNLKNTDFDPTGDFVFFTKEGWKQLGGNFNTQPDYNYQLNLHIAGGIAVTVHLNITVDHR